MHFGLKPLRECFQEQTVIMGDFDAGSSECREEHLLLPEEEEEKEEEQKPSTKEQDVQRKMSSTSLDNCVSETASTKEQGIKRKKSSTSLDNCVSVTASTKEQGIKRKKSSASLDNCVSEAASTSSDDFDNEIKQEIKQSARLQQRIAALGGNGPALSAWKRELDAMEIELRKEYAVYRAAKDLSDDKAEQKGEPQKTEQVKNKLEYEYSQLMDSQI